MRRTYLPRPGMTAVAGGLLLATASAPLLAAADDGTQLRVVCEQTGHLVEITIEHSGIRTLSGRVVLEVVSDGRSTLEVVPFRVWGGQKVAVHWVSPTPLDRVEQVGIIVDDGVPI